MGPGPAARLIVAVRSVEARHEVKLSKSPREQALKHELRKMPDWEG
jgi:hypothetical protein